MGRANMPSGKESLVAAPLRCHPSDSRSRYRAVSSEPARLSLPLEASHEVVRRRIAVTAPATILARGISSRYAPRLGPAMWATPGLPVGNEIRQKNESLEAEDGVDVDAHRAVSVAASAPAGRA